MRRFWFGLLIVVAVVVGIVLGIGLTIISVILPRSRELALAQETSPFLRQFEPLPLLEAASSVKGWSISGTNDTEMGTDRILCRTFEASARLPPEAKPNFGGQLSAQLTMAANAAGLQVWSTSSSSGGQVERYSLQYTDRRRPAVIHCWCIDQGETMRVIIAVFER